MLPYPLTATVVICRIIQLAVGNNNVVTIKPVYRATVDQIESAIS